MGSRPESTRMLLSPRIGAVLLLVLSTLVACSAPPAARRRPVIESDRVASCEVTLPSAEHVFGDNFRSNHGNRFLATVLYPNGTVAIGPDLPLRVGADGSIWVKVPWWRQGRGQLRIEATRIGGEPLHAKAEIPPGYGDTGMQASRINFPSPGCWRVRGIVPAGELAFVLRVTYPNAQ